MCGRYASTRSSADLATLFEAADDTGGDRPVSYNVAPTDEVAVVRQSRRQQRRVLSQVRWGLVPSWAKDPGIGGRMFNARSETVADSKAYRRPFQRKRCLVPADGWFEWRKLANGKKQPYFCTAGDEPVVFAGLWEYWQHGEQSMLTCTVLTTPAIGDMEQIHDRMPLVLSPQRHAAWLGETPASTEELLAPPDTATLRQLELRPVSRAVGNVRNNSPQLLERVDEADMTSDSDAAQGSATLF